MPPTLHTKQPSPRNHFGNLGGCVLRTGAASFLLDCLRQTWSNPQKVRTGVQTLQEETPDCTAQPKEYYWSTLARDRGRGVLGGSHYDWLLVES